MLVTDQRTDGNSIEICGLKLRIVLAEAGAGTGDETKKYSAKGVGRRVLVE